VDLSLTAVYSALSAAQSALEANAQDLANVRTTGYRPQQTYFESALSATWQAGDGAQQDLPWAVQLRAGQPMDKAGPLQTGQGPLQVALSNSDDYFSVQTPQGTAYTRNGDFHLDPSGQLQDPFGDAVLGANGPLQATQGKAQINPDGSFVSAPGSPPQKLDIVNLKGLQLQRQGAQMFTVTGGQSGGPPQGSVLPGQLEGSGSDIFKGMSDMVVLMRWSESVQKAAHANDDAAKAVIDAAKLT